MAAVHKPRPNRLVLDGEPWESYERILKIFDGRRHLRITFDRGLLEIMTLSLKHEGFKYIIARLLAVLTEELGLAIECYGSMTFKRKKTQRGLEPDDCYWIQNQAQVRNLKKYDPKTNPPPDLVVEVDIESSSANRMGIYRKMKVPEVLRHDGQVLQFHVLGPKGYALSGTSRAFPGLKSADLEPFIAMRDHADANTISRQFRAWVQGRIAANWQ
jgi:Uma2 family endonuclease